MQLVTNLVMFWMTLLSIEESGQSQYAPVCMCVCVHSGGEVYSVCMRAIACVNTTLYGFLLLLVLWFVTQTDGGRVRETLRTISCHFSLFLSDHSTRKRG